MQFPLSTGQAAQALSVTEPQLAELVRRGKIQPPPTVFAGRRVWNESHVRQAARHLGRRLTAIDCVAADAAASRGEP